MKIKRNISQQIQSLINKPVIFLSGPKQVGKAFLSQNFLGKNCTYLNYDQADDRKIIQDQSWPRGNEILILDGIHKMDEWKSWLRKVKEKKEAGSSIIVSGSASLKEDLKDTEGYLSLRLHPFTLKELNPGNKKKVITTMMDLGAFPEPFLEGDPRFAKNWRQRYLEKILREDLLDLEKVQQLKKIEDLILILSEKVGSALNYADIARSLKVSSHTIKHWLNILERLYIVFKVSPLSEGISKAILKAPKYYFYDTGRVKGNENIKLENIVACHLLKRNHYLIDYHNEKLDLFYIKDKIKREVTFVTKRNGSIEKLIDVNMEEETLSPSLKYFQQKLNPIEAAHLVFHLKVESHVAGAQVKDLANYLFSLEI